jgi:glycine/D-amino acid oxidase-like deaminating enzyme/nitrite reductase/ring-hydroxylating ferredoxin subunit
MDAGGDAYPPLEGGRRVDVAVIGGGIAGAAAALMLQAEGRSVALVEASTIGSGVTGHTTAKVSSLQGLVYGELQSKFGDAGARVYAEANEAGLAWIAERVAADGIDCDFRRRSNYTYVTDPDARGDVEAEVEAATAAGLPVRLVDDTPLPYPVAAAVRLDDQAEFHPRKFVLALAASVAKAGGLVAERTRALDVTEGSPCLVETDRGELQADHVIVASHFPFLDRSLAFARMHPERSYCVGVRIAAQPPEGMFISADSPTRSIRSHPLGDGELLIVGGEGHKTGQGGDTRERYRRLEEFARANWPVESVDYRWSSQDNVTADRMPYVGPVTPASERVLYATGFAKWGLANGVAAAMILTDLVAGRDNPWADTFRANRIKPLAQATDLVKENVNVAKRFFGDRLATARPRPVSELAPGEGDIVQVDGEKVAAYRRDDGTIEAVSAVCTHLGCQVAWNPAETSWDCPCHGSRFAPDGSILQGPAVDGLEPRPLAG